MIVIISRIPNTSTPKDIEAFIKPALKSFNPFKKRRCDKPIITFWRNGHDINFYSLINCDDETGNILIKKLDKKQLLGKHVSVREYVIRSWRNDRRTSNKSIDTISGLRHGDRRMTQLVEIQPEIVLTSSDKKLARKYN